MQLQAEKTRINDGPAPKRYTRGLYQREVAKMKRGQWVIVSKKKARSMLEAIKGLGGSATTYRATETGWCFKVLEAVKGT